MSASSSIISYTRVQTTNGMWAVLCCAPNDCEICNRNSLFSVLFLEKWRRLSQKVIYWSNCNAVIVSVGEIWFQDRLCYIFQWFLQFFDQVLCFVRSIEFLNKYIVLWFCHNWCVEKFWKKLSSFSIPAKPSLLTKPSKYCDFYDFASFS